MFEDKIMDFASVCLGILLIALTLIILVCGYCMVRDTEANIKIKERIAENGIEITTKQLKEIQNMSNEELNILINELLEEE